ncbi:MAG TPA: DUF6798 domain-containing protein [Terriglobales bacterium]|nr:DUF6798 domain-containing protein [Terriglobales bacterium]
MQPSTQTAPRVTSSAGDWSLKNLVPLSLLTAFAFAVMGYHPGLEDDAFYLAAIKRNLNPALFPHDSQFFTVQFQATIFDKLIAFSTRLSHLPLAWVELFWQLAAIFFMLHGCWRISRRCFRGGSEQWAAVTMIAALLTLPVSGTAINLADQYLHPRNLATAAILAAIVAVLDSHSGDSGNRNKNRHLWLAGILLAVAFAIHAIMASFGISFCIFLYFSLSASTAKRLSPFPVAAALLFPLGWIFEPASDAWRKAASTRSFYYLSRWAWYEWLGIFAPLLLLWLFRRFLQRRAMTEPDAPALRPLVDSLLYYGIFQTVVGLAIMLPQSFERLRPFEPMRYLHLLYLLFFLLAGGLLGRYVLGRHAYRWLLLFVPLSAGMFYAQRQMYPTTAHIEWPGAQSKNAWLQAFAWIRENTPVDALFALDPHYMQLPGEDYHGFRALAERSVLADYDKDGGMAARVPRLAPRWLKEVTAQTGWQNFGPEDFQRLKHEFGVRWVIVSSADKISTQPLPPDAGITCPYQNRQLRICRLY